MHPIRRLSLAEQTAAHLREGLRRGRWRGTLPGLVRLAAELDVSTYPAEFIPGGSIGTAPGAERVIVPGTGAAGGKP